jgi:hypothetical protein
MPLFWALGLLLIGEGAGAARRCWGQETERLREITTALVAGGGDRSAGSDAARETADLIAHDLALIPEAAVYRQPFVMPVPVVDACRAEVMRGGKPAGAVPLAPLSPAGAQLAAVPADQQERDLVYAGQGSVGDLDGHVIADRFVALDADADPIAWRTVASLGARAVIFLGGRDTTNAMLRALQTTAPVGIPRFYCDDPAGVAAIRSGAVGRLRLDVRLHWQPRSVENILCYVPGRQAQPTVAAQEAPRWMEQLVVLQTRYDAPAAVLTRAPGATAAANAAALMQLTHRIAALPNHCAVLVAFTAGDEWSYRGAGALLDLLQPEQKNFGEAVAALRHRAGELQARLTREEALEAALRRVAAGAAPPPGDAALGGALDDEFLRESSAADEALQAARLRHDTAA